MEEALKQRLVGASVLVVLAVIFLPLLFDGSGMAKPSAPMSLDLPEASSNNTVTITLKPQQSLKAPAPKPVKVVKAVKPKPKPIVIAPKTQPASGSQWIVQLGSFSQRANAQTLRDKLINKGYKSFVESSGKGHSQVYRVRVGPEASREIAEKIRLKLKDREKRNGLVMAYP